MLVQLLRKFHDLMLANSLEPSEECPICMTTMEINQASRYAESYTSLRTPPCLRHHSLPCQHVFCNDCIHQVASTTQDEEDTFPCPSCREQTSLDDAETVAYTSAMQWDALLEVAYASAKLDQRRGDLDTSDEEAEEEARDNFIEDENEESEDAMYVHASHWNPSWTRVLIAH